MRAIKFKGANAMFTDTKDEYNNLPAMYDSSVKEGFVVTCYRLSFIERIRVLILGHVWFSVMTFNKPLQPQYPTTKRSDLIGNEK